MQWPLGYPQESRRRRSAADGGAAWGPVLLWDDEGGVSAQRSSYWGDYYRQNERRPEVTAPAPWVAG